MMPTPSETSHPITPATPSLSQQRLLILEPSPGHIAQFVPSIQSPPSSLNRSNVRPSHQCHQSLIPPLLQVLTGELPSPVANGQSEERRSFAGYTSHPPLRVRTRYFDRRVGIWCDEVPLTVLGGIGDRGGQGRELSVLKGVPGGEGEDRQDSITGVSGKGKGDDDGSTAASILRFEHESPSHGSTALPKEREAEEEAKENQNSTPKEFLSDAEDATVTTNTWITQMLGPQALEVRNAIGAIILTLPLPDALESNRNSSSSSSAAPLPDLDLNDSNEDEPQTSPYQYKLKPDYITLISAINTLRSTIEEERAAGPNGGDIAAVIILQGSLSPKPTLQKQNPPTAPAENENDMLLEAIEEQLLNPTATTTQDTDNVNTANTPILGWDIVLWNGIVNPTQPRAEEDRSEKRNIYGEKTGLPRVLEVLEAVDWTAPGHESSDTFSHPDDEDHDLFTGILGPAEDADQELAVEQLQSLLHQAMSLKEAGGDMSTAERRRAAKRIFGQLTS